MSSRGLAAFVAGLGTGYFQGEDKKKQEARQKRLDDQADELHGARMAELNDNATDRRQARADRDAIREAAAVRSVETPNDVLNDDDGNAMPAVGQFRTGGQRFETRDAAQSAADAANTPEARSKRVIAAMEGTGNVLGATQLRGAQAQVTEAEQKVADRALQRSISSLQTPEAIADFITRSPADGMDGKLKVQAVKSPDGKTFQFVSIGEDGTQKPAGPVFANDAMGLEKARQTLAGYTTPETRMAHYRWEQEQARATARDEETSRHNKAMEKNTAEANAARADAAASRLALARMQSEQGTGRVTAKDVQDASNNINSRVTEIFQPKEGMTTDERKALGAQRDKAASQALGIWKTNNLAGIVTDTGTAIMAATLAADSKNLMQRQASDGNTYPGVIVNGQFVITGGPLQPASPAAAPAAAPPAGPGARAAQAGTAAPAQAPVAPAAPAAPAISPIVRALGGDVNNETLRSLAERNAAPLEAQAAKVKQAQAMVAAAGRSGDSQSVQNYTAAYTTEQKKLDAMLEQMNPQQARAVRAALGM